MPTETPTLMTANAMAKDLGVSEAKLKKAILELGLVPTARKGCCSYYTVEDRRKLKGVLG